MDVGHSQQSQTSTVQGVEFEMGGIRVKLFDTPGFNDQNLSDTEVLQILADWLQIQSVPPGPSCCRELTYFLSSRTVILLISS